MLTHSSYLLVVYAVIAGRSGDVERVFGEETLRHAINIARGHVDFLPRLPRQVLVKIIGYLPLEDIADLSCVSKQFHEVFCRRDTVLLLYVQHTVSVILRPNVY